VSSITGKESWTIDQITKSEFFHQKLHEWGLLEIAYELEDIKGETFDWDLKELNISIGAWNKIIHRGIKPVLVFTHPDVLKQNPKRISYYRMLSMVSQKSMTRIGLGIKKYEEGTSSLDDAAFEISRHFNRIISILIEHDEEIDEREFDLWRGMAAGSQAQGSWQNTKGDREEAVIKELIGRKVRERKLIFEESTHRKTKILKLKDGRTLILGSEPDIGVYRDDKVEVAVEIKGGIDSAGVHERFGAALKSLRRAKQENRNAITILIIRGVSLTLTAKEEIEDEKIIDHFFTIEDVIGNEEVNKNLFEIMGI
jgi:hypothetical protein